MTREDQLDPKKAGILNELSGIKEGLTPWPIPVPTVVTDMTKEEKNVVNGYLEGTPLDKGWQHADLVALTNGLKLISGAHLDVEDANHVQRKIMFDKAITLLAEFAKTHKKTAKDFEPVLDKLLKTGMTQKEKELVMKGLPQPPAVAVEPAPPEPQQPAPPPPPKKPSYGVISQTSYLTKNGWLLKGQADTNGDFTPGSFTFVGTDGRVHSWPFSHMDSPPVPPPAWASPADWRAYEEALRNPKPKKFYFREPGAHPEDKASYVIYDPTTGVLSSWAEYTGQEYRRRDGSVLKLGKGPGEDIIGR
jgi:hypothetical protein